MKRSIYLLSILFSLFFQQGLSQSFAPTPIQGVINKYTAVNSILCLEENDVDSVEVSDLTGFGVGDTVMLYCVQGSKIVTDTSGPFFKEMGGDSLNPGNTGRYAFLIINEIYTPGKVVVFNNKISPHIKTMREGEVAQLIRVPSYRNAEVTSAGLSADPWDGTKGGVITLFASVLELDGDISASGKGFRGASEDSDYLYNCSSENMALLDSPFYHIDNYSAGKKGEGTTNRSFDLLRGMAKNINGGGGGNGLFSGGGGGSNFWGGGMGGWESGQCASGLENPGGKGGTLLGGSTSRYYYYNFYNDIPTIANRYDRLFFGGGGGSGTRKPGITTSDGGNGGGLVVIVADSIIGNNHSILADGLDALDAEGAAGGGGGGGCIVLDVNGYRTNLNLSVKGGNGGNTIGTPCTGPGGGGGGGVYWLSGIEDQHPEIRPNNEKGLAGQCNGTDSYGATDGTGPGDIYGLFAPIRGFIFNPVPNQFTVCSDMLPQALLAAEPKGGDGPESGYTYLWVDSSSTQNAWLPAPGTNDEQNYNFPANLSDTTYFRRIVTSGILPPDTSFRIAVYVHPEITNNTIASPDTVCSGNAPELFEPSALIGGGPTGPRSYTYVWKKDEGSGMSNAEGDFTDSAYQSPGLTTTTNFYRIAKAGVCVDTSAPLNVKVWENHTTFQISDNDTVCYTDAPGLLSSQGAVPPGEGDQNDIRYQWIRSTDASAWADISGATSESYQPTGQTQDVYYSRIVLSGSDNACVDTADFVEILNIRLIENNTISESQTVCTDGQAALLTGSDPTGGYDDVQFSYFWQDSTLSSGWNTVEGGDTSMVKRDYDPGVMDGDTTWYRRVVGAGGVARNVCISFSDELVINVLPPITNNLITTSDSVLCEEDFLEDLVQKTAGGSTPIGGDDTWVYQWQVATGADNPGEYSDVAGATAIDYLDNPVLSGDEDRWYRRRVYSGPGDVCQDFSLPVHIEVHTGITNNSIDPVDSACFNSEKLVQGALPLGEDGLTPAYTWRDVLTGADLPGANEQNYSYTFDIQQVYQFERETRIGACTDTSNAMLIAVMQLPGGVLSGDIPRSCETDVLMTVDLNQEVLDTYIVPWEIYLDDGVNLAQDGPYILNEDGDIEVSLNTDEDSTQFTYTLGSIVYRSVTGRYVCEAPAEQLSGQIPIEVFRTPDPEITKDGSATVSSKVCGTTITLEANSDRGTGVWTFSPSEYIAESPTGGNGFAISVPDVSEAYGTYLATFTSTAGVCSGADSIDLYYFEQPEPAYAGEDTLLFLINSVQLKADPPTAGTGTWTVYPSGPAIDDPDAPVTMAHNLEMNVENEFTWTIINGEDEGTCISTSDFKVVTRTEVKRYQGFSPNGDMDNEYFIMQGMIYADEFKITFFNSLGSTVKVVTHENVDELEVNPGQIVDIREDELVVWDGTSENGTPVPSGTYYYAVEYKKDGKIYPYTDYVVLLRDD